METCENCNRLIGNLEPAHVFNGHVVCDECHRRLSAARPEQLTQAAVPTTPQRLPQAVSRRCPRCGYEGVISQRGVVGSEVLACLILLALFVIPGIIFYAVKDGNLYCPHCRTRV